jgi:exportin-5
VYEIVRPMHPAIVLNIMQQIPNLNINDLQKLDEKILHSNPLTNTTNQASANAASGTTQPAANQNRQSNKIDKTRKDLFKKITSHLMGRNVLANLFRNPPPVINDLRPLNNNNKQKKNTNLLESAEPETGVQMQHLFRNNVPR